MYFQRPSPMPQSSLLLFVAAVFTAASTSTSTAAASADNIIFSNCSQTFNCGTIRNITYPFTGAERPSHCGPPEFRLSCVDGSTYLSSTTSPLTFKVLQLSQTQHSLTIARTDLSNDTCIQNNYLNTTLNTTIFNYDASNEHLTIFYACSTLMTQKPQNMFTCNINGSESSAYYLLGAVPSDPILNVSKCNVSVSVPVLRSAADMLISNRSLLREALREGFEVNYTNIYDEQCGKCIDKGGRCGFDSALNEPICICGDEICSNSGNKNGVSLGIGLALAGAGITGILVGFWIFSWRQKKMRKKAAAAESQAQAQSAVTKDITPPSSREGLLATSTSNYSRSTPSFMSTQTDIEKGSTYFGVQVFSYVELEEATQHFDPSRELGDGGFGTVYYGVLQDGRVVAVKRLYENNFKRMEQFMNEVEILTRLRHKNLVTLYGCTSRRSRELLLVYEYIPNGTVADHVHGKKASSSLLPWNVRLNIAIETADALTFLHKSDVIHRDVKTNNILLDNSFRVKVADFGLSRLFPNDATHVSTAPQGTPGYVDPEYYQCYQLTDKSDVYSFGVVLCELISSKQAVDTNRHRQDINLANMAISKIQNHALNELVDPSLGFDTDNGVRRMTTLVAELAFRCLQQEREMRPTMEEVLRCLLQIKNEEIGTIKAEVVDIHSDDVGQIKSSPPPFSPDSVVIDKWISSSTPNSY